MQGNYFRSMINIYKEILHRMNNANMMQFTLSTILIYSDVSVFSLRNGWTGKGKENMANVWIHSGAQYFSSGQCY